MPGEMPEPKTPSESKSEDDHPLSIQPLKTNKSEISCNPYMEAGIVCKHPCSILICGKSGSGKTNLVATMLTDHKMYAKAFDLVFLFSDTAEFGGDDIYAEHLEDLIPEKHMFTPDNEGLKQLRHIVKTQKAIIKKSGIPASPKILLIFDDIAHRAKFLKSKEYLLLHIANRHLNISCFSLTQSYVKIPRSCRCQVSGVIFFHGATNTEKIRLASEHCPSSYHDKEFCAIVDFATQKKYSFLFINKQVAMRERYRMGLSQIIELQRC